MLGKPKIVHYKWSISSPPTTFAYHVAYLGDRNVIKMCTQNAAQCKTSIQIIMLQVLISETFKQKFNK